MTGDRVTGDLVTGDLARELEVARAAVRAAAEVCRRVQAAIPATLVKGDKSPVTEADFASQALVCRALATAFPADPVVGEESADALRSPEQAALAARVLARVREVVASASLDEVLGWIDHGAGRETPMRYWTLDPIDGTKGFLRGDQYAVGLALVRDGRVALAAVAAPNLPVTPGEDGPRGVLFHAVRGGGAWAAPLDGPLDGSAARLRVSDRQDPTAGRLTESVEPGHTDQAAAGAVAAALGIGAPPRRLDSLAKYGVVARGEAEVYLRLPRAGYRENIWDHAAGVLLVTEAGGTVSDGAGNPLRFDQGSTLHTDGALVVSHGPWHARILEALRAV